MKSEEEIKKYKQALEEIRKIAKSEINNLTESAINGGRYLEIKEIIDEVLND